MNYSVIIQTIAGKKDKLPEIINMGIKYFSLGTNENNKVVKTIRILFGVVCFGVAIFWVIFNIASEKTNATIWISIIFLAGFGFYQVWSGLGRATSFIEIGTDCIRIKKNPVLPPIDIKAGEIEKIELYPLNIIFFLRSKKRKLLRFGTTYHETSYQIKDEILSFADLNKIFLEIIEDKL